MNQKGILMIFIVVLFAIGSAVYYSSMPKEQEVQEPAQDTLMDSEGNESMLKDQTEPERVVSEDEDTKADKGFYELQVQFYLNANPQVVQKQFSDIGLTMYPKLLRTNKVLVATPDRSQGKFYTQKLQGDALVERIDDRYTDDNLQKYNEIIKEDAAYLWVYFLEPMSGQEVQNWLQRSYPSLIDVMYQQPGGSDFRIVAIHETRGETSAGFANYWGQYYRMTVLLPPFLSSTEAKEYKSKVENLKTVDLVSLSSSCSHRLGSCTSDKACVEGTYCSEWLKQCVPIGCTFELPLCLSSDTMIDTPHGKTNIKDLHAGMEVWTMNFDGERITAKIKTTQSTPVAGVHLVKHVTLADGRSIIGSPGHPTSDGRTLGKLKVADVLDGSVVVEVKINEYQQQFTFDILPEGNTGYYWANGILVGSTLNGH